MGVTSSALPELARLSVQFTLLPFIMAIWFHNRSQTGWGVAVTFVGFYEYVIRWGLGVQNPILLYSGTDITQGTYIYFVVFGSLLLVSAFCGTGIAWLLDLRYPMPAETLLPISPGHTITSPLTADRNDAQLAQQDAALTPDNSGLNAYGFSSIPRPWGQTVVTFLAFVFAVALPFVIYEQVYPTSGWGAWLGAVLVAAAFHLLFGVYLHFRASLYTDGVTEHNLKERDVQLQLLRKEDDGRPQDPELSQRERDLARTRWGIWKSVLITGALETFGLILFAGVATFGDPAYVDTLWILEAVVIGALLLIVAVIVFIYSRVSQWRFEQSQLANESSSPARQAAPEEPEGDETTQTSSLISRAKIAKAADSFLGSRRGRS